MTSALSSGQFCVDAGCQFAREAYGRNLAEMRRVPVIKAGRPVGPHVINQANSGPRRRALNRLLEQAQRTARLSIPEPAAVRLTWFGSRRRAQQRHLDWRQHYDAPNPTRTHIRQHLVQTPDFQRVNPVVEVLGPVPAQLANSVLGLERRQYKTCAGTGEGIPFFCDYVAHRALPRVKGKHTNR